MQGLLLGYPGAQPNRVDQMIPIPPHANNAVYAFIWFVARRDCLDYECLTSM